MAENICLCTVAGAAESNELFESSRRSVVAVPWSHWRRIWFIVMVGHNNAASLKAQNDPDL